LRHRRGHLCPRALGEGRPGSLAREPRSRPKRIKWNPLHANTIQARVNRIPQHAFEPLQGFVSAGNGKARKADCDAVLVGLDAIDQVAALGVGKRGNVGEELLDVVRLRTGEPAFEFKVSPLRNSIGD